MVTRDVLKVFQIALAYGSCNFENFQNITRAHKSRNAPAVHAISYTYFYLLPGLFLSPFLLLLLPKAKDLLSCFLKNPIKGVDVHLLFFPQGLEAVLQLPPESLSGLVISQFAGVNLLSPHLSSSCSAQLQ